MPEWLADAAQAATLDAERETAAEGRARVAEARVARLKQTPPEDPAVLAALEAAVALEGTRALVAAEHVVAAVVALEAAEALSLIHI